MNTYSLLQTLTIEDAAKKTKLPARLIFQWLADGQLQGYAKRPHRLEVGRLTSDALRAAFLSNSDTVRLHMYDEDDPDCLEDYERFVSTRQIIVNSDELDLCIERKQPLRLVIVKPDFSEVLYGRRQFRFKPDQAKLIKRLYEGAIQGAPELSGSDLISDTGIDRAEDRIDKILRSQKNPILGILVLRGSKRGTFRLAPFDEP